MNKKTRQGALLAAVLGLMLTAGVALAHMPSISIDAIPDMQFATFPQNYSITGTATHAEVLPPPGIAGDNVCALNAMKVLVNDGVNPEVTVLDQGNPAGYFGWTCDLTTANWNAAWSIPGPGTYTITAKIRHQGDEGTDTEETVVSQITITECPAAPSIAVHYLMDLGVKSGGAAWKKVVKAVAGQTGSNGTLWAANACEAWYPDAVIAFVNATL